MPNQRQVVAKMDSDRRWYWGQERVRVPRIYGSNHSDNQSASRASSGAMVDYAAPRSDVFAMMYGPTPSDPALEVHNNDGAVRGIYTRLARGQPASDSLQSLEAAYASQYQMSQQMRMPRSALVMDDAVSMLPVMTSSVNAQDPPERQIVFAPRQRVNGHTNTPDPQPQIGKVPLAPLSAVPGSVYNMVSTWSVGPERPQSLAQGARPDVVFSGGGGPANRLWRSQQQHKNQKVASVRS